MQSLSPSNYLATGDLEAYQKSAAYLIRMAENDFSISLSPSTKDNIKTLSRNVFVIDDYFDTLAAPLKGPAVAHILGYLEKGGKLSLDSDAAEIALKHIKRTIDETTPEGRETFINSVKEIFACAKILSSTSNPAEFVAAREREGFATANLLLSAFPELGENKKYSAFLRKVTAMGNCIDSIVDMPQDKSAGEVSAKLPMSVYFRLSAKTVCDAVSLVTHYPRKRAFLHYAKRFVEYMRELKEREDPPPSPSYPEPLPVVVESQRADL